MSLDHEKRKGAKAVQATGKPEEGRVNSMVKSGPSTIGWRGGILIIASLQFLINGSDIWCAIWTPEKVQIEDSEQLDDYWEQRSKLMNQAIEVRERIADHIRGGASLDDVSDLKEKVAQITAKEEEVAAVQDAERSRLKQEARFKLLRMGAIWGGLFVFSSALLIAEGYRESKQRENASGTAK